MLQLVRALVGRLLRLAGVGRAAVTEVWPWISSRRRCKTSHTTTNGRGETSGVRKLRIREKIAEARRMSLNVAELPEPIISISSHSSRRRQAA